MSKNKKKNLKKLKKTPLFIINTIVGVCLVISLAILTNIFLQNKNLEEQQKLQKENIERQLALKIKQKQLEEKRQEQEAKYFEEKTKAMEIEYTNEETIVENITKKKKEKNIFHYISEENQTKQTLTTTKIIKKLPQQKKYKKHKKIKYVAKLAIIIDDVTTTKQIKKIKNIPYPITMSFLPPTSRHKNSAKITKNIPIYMIHLPLEAKSRRYEESNTLHIEDNINTINKRIETLKKLYPKAKYINNHTGSKFTKNKKAMDKLLKILKKYNYIFVDSRTTAKTATKKYANKYHLRYLSRNVFLDNTQNKKYIQKQLQKAANIAKRNGYAIAIGHPHNITLKTLAQSKHLLKGLDIILIDKL